MRVLLQRVKEASVSVDGKIAGSIGKGLLLFLGFHKEDSEEMISWYVDKLVGLRVFSDHEDKMNLSAQDIGAQMLVVSQFTLYGTCAKGRRPEFTSAMRGSEAEALYRVFIEQLTAKGINVQAGVFGAKMDVHLINDGPVTLLI